MFATIYLPNFYLQAALRHEVKSQGKAAVLIDDQERTGIIIQLNQLAENAGVRKGMTPSQALARCSDLVIKSRSPAREKMIEEIALHCAFSLSPYVEATGPGLYTVEFRDKRELLRKVSAVIAQLGDCEIVAQAGISELADTSFLAAHLARPVLEVDETNKFLAPLPIDILAIALEG
jgi:nucleotidyltransferase/DNA polymerase involved in DNA repair